MIGAPRGQARASLLLLCLTAAAGTAAAQANDTVVVQGSGSKTTADFVRAILRNTSAGPFAGQPVSLPFNDVESPQGAPQPRPHCSRLHPCVAKGFPHSCAPPGACHRQRRADTCVHAQLTKTSCRSATTTV